MERLKVAIRLRPFLSNENESNTGINMNPNDDKTIMISKSLKTFKGTFDKILSTNSTQRDVFNFIKPCVYNIQKGINCTILAYGQTGSGKTYTMFGGDWSFSDNMKKNNKKNLTRDEYNFLLNKELVIDPFSETNGIIPNLIMQLFNIYNNNKNSEDENDNNNNLLIKCSYIQVYNEKIYDLLEEIDQNEQKKNFELITYKNRNEKLINQTPLKLKYDKIKGILIEGVKEIETPTFFDIFDVLSLGETNRKIRQTNKNDMSSRSHTIFIINIEDNNLQIQSKIKLCDLAGSERYDSSETYKKEHINELCNINKSLFVLGNVIHYLASKKKNKKFIPYKDSKLTQILEDSLSGNSSIYLIATISPNDENFEETINTLKFADRAHEVMTEVTPNQIINNDLFGEGSKKEVHKLYKELSELKQLLLLREKRGNLNPLQAQFLKLKKENVLLKKYLGGGNNINAFEKLIQENNDLKKEIKELTSQNLILKNEKSSDNIINNNNNNINSNIDLNYVNGDFKKRLFKNSLSDINIFQNYKNNYSLMTDKTNNNINSTTLMNTGNTIINIRNKSSNSNRIVSNTFDKENKYNEKRIIDHDLNTRLLNVGGINQNKNYNIKRNYNSFNKNFKTVDLENLGINKKYHKNKNIIESLKRIKILDDLSKNNYLNLNNNSKKFV